MLKVQLLTKNKAFSLVEIIIAIAIFLIFLSTLLGLTYGFWKQTRNSVNKERATYLAQEALEAARSIRDASFTNLADGTHGVSVLSNQYNFTGASDVTDIFTRQMTISTINATQKKVDVTVSWADQNSPTNSVTLSTYLTDWRKLNPLGGLTILKTVINHGDNKSAADFALYTVSASVTSGDPPVTETVVTPMTLGVAAELEPNTYTVAENSNSNYTQTFSGDCNSSGVVTINAGDAKVCTIINEEKPSQLVVNKVVTNHGLSKTVSDFSLFVDASPVVSGQTNTFNSGSHTVSETADPSYNATFSGDCNSSGVVILAPNTTKICTLTNEEKRSYITVGKNIINHGGSAVASDFTPYKIDGNTVALGDLNVVNSGSHTVSETNTPNYTQTFSGDCNSSGVVSVNSGESKNCVITNEENLSQVTVNKTVINHGQSKTASDFAPYKVGVTEVALGVSTGFSSGTYTVSETTDSNYNQSFSNDCNSSGVINLVGGTSKICSITNEEKLSYVTVNKTVINHGLSNTTSSFAPYKVGATTVSLGTPTNLNSGTYNVTETFNSAYNYTFSGDCNSSGSITLTPGATKVCNITNEERASYITVNKNVINHGGTATTATFAPYKVDATTVSLGSATQFDSGSHTVSETTNPDYVQTFSGDCNSLGVVSLTSGASKVCSITNEQRYIPTVTSPTSASITSSTATLGANVTDLGLPAAISARGICYATTATPTSNCTPQGGTTTGVYTQSIASLIPGTLYYYRGYATNAKGTGYSVDGTFTTLGGACQITGITPTTYDNSSSISGVVTKPSGVVQNDILFAYVMHNNATDRLNSIPSGWTQIARHKNGNSNQALFYKVATASEPASYTFGLSSSSRFAITINAYRGCFDTTNPIESFSNVEYVTNNTTVRAASVTPASNYSTVIMFPSINTSGARTFTAPATQGGGWGTDYNQGNSSSQFSRSAFSKLITSSGATGVIDSICSTSGTTNKHAFAVVLHPVP